MDTGWQIIRWGIAFMSVDNHALMEQMASAASSGIGFGWRAARQAASGSGRTRRAAVYGQRTDDAATANRDARVSLSHRASNIWTSDWITAICDAIFRQDLHIFAFACVKARRSSTAELVRSAVVRRPRIPAGWIPGA